MPANRYTYNGFAIKALRRKSFLSRKAMALALEIGVAHLSNIEANRRPPSLELAMQIAAVLGQDDLRTIMAGSIPEDPVPVVAEPVA